MAQSQPLDLNDPKFSKLNQNFNNQNIHVCAMWLNYDELHWITQIFAIRNKTRYLK